MMPNDPDQRRNSDLYDEIYRQQEESPSQWQQFRRALPYYGAAVPFLSAGLAGLFGGLWGNKKKRRD